MFQCPLFHTPYQLKQQLSNQLKQLLPMAHSAKAAFFTVTVVIVIIAFVFTFTFAFNPTVLFSKDF
jgi:hypothetical protein